jgi:hypothetical protein
MSKLFSGLYDLYGQDKPARAPHHARNLPWAAHMEVFQRLKEVAAKGSFPPHCHFIMMDDGELRLTVQINGHDLKGRGRNLIEAAEDLGRQSEQLGALVARALSGGDQK